MRENTLAAFVEAVSLGVAGVELDVRRTLDGALVVHHDATVEFLRISQSPARDLPGYVPHLDHVLSTCSDVMVNVEIKNSPDEPDYDSSGSLADAVVACVAASATRVVVSCFDLATCDEVRRRDESIDLAWLVHRGLGEELLETAHDHGCRALNPHVSMVSDSLQSRANEVGLALNVWTVNARRDLLAMGRLGVESVITDEPALALELLGAGSGRRDTGAAGRGIDEHRLD